MPREFLLSALVAGRDYVINASVRIQNRAAAGDGQPRIEGVF